MKRWGKRNTLKFRLKIIKGKCLAQMYTMKLSTRCAHQIHYPNQERRSSVGDESAPDCDKCRLNKLTKKTKDHSRDLERILSQSHTIGSAPCVYAYHQTLLFVHLHHSFYVKASLFLMKFGHCQLAINKWLIPVQQVFVFLILTQCFCVIRRLLAQQIQASCLNWVHELGEPQKYLEY